MIQSKHKINYFKAESIAFSGIRFSYIKDSYLSDQEKGNYLFLHCLAYPTWSNTFPSPQNVLSGLRKIPHSLNIKNFPAVPISHLQLL